MRPHDETMEYIRRAQAGDKAALDALVSDNIALVKSIAARFGGRGVEWDDLFQLGCMGLVKAIRGFDLSYEVRFSTYAVPMIMGEIRRFLRDDGQVRVSRVLREKARACFKAREELEREHGREPTIEELAGRAGLDVADAVEAMAAVRSVRSLSEPVGEDSMTLGDTIGKDDSERQIEHMELERGISALDGRESELINLRYFQNLTQSQTGARLGISQVQVSRMESRIMTKLRERMSG